MSEEKSIALKIAGMHCASCVAVVERALRLVPGVSDVIVNLKQGKAIIYGPVSPEELVKAVTRTGYEASILAEDVQKSARGNPGKTENGKSTAV